MKVAKPAGSLKANSKATSAEGAPKATARQSKAADAKKTADVNDRSITTKSQTVNAKGKAVTTKGLTVNAKGKAVDTTGVGFPASLQWESSEEDRPTTKPVKGPKDKVSTSLLKYTILTVFP